MPLPLRKGEREAIARKVHQLWICYYGMKEARKISKLVRKLFREEKLRINDNINRAEELKNKKVHNVKRKV